MIVAGSSARHPERGAAEPHTLNTERPAVRLKDPGQPPRLHSVRQSLEPAIRLTSHRTRCDGWCRPGCDVPAQGSTAGPESAVVVMKSIGLAILSAHTQN